MIRITEHRVVVRTKGLSTPTDDCRSANFSLGKVFRLNAQPVSWVIAVLPDQYSSRLIWLKPPVRIT